MELAAPAARWLLYVGAALAIGRGTLTFLDADGAAPTNDGNESGAIRRAMHFASFALIAATLLLLVLQMQALELTVSEVPGLLRDTVWGRGWTQLSVACLATAVVLPLRSTRNTSLLLTMAALGVAAAMGGLGHAAADEQWPLGSRLLDAMHVAAMGAWIGGLALMVLASMSLPRPSAAEWQRFSRTATVMAPLAIASGVGSAWRRLATSTPADVLSSSYGRLLLLKALFAMSIVVLGYSQRARLASGAGVTRAVVLREVVLAVVVLGCTAWLTGMEPPGT